MPLCAFSSVQILKILQNKSVRGLSLVSFELEVIGYTIALAYCLHKGMPFSAYGELAFLLIQGSSTLNIVYRILLFLFSSLRWKCITYFQDEYYSVTIWMFSIVGHAEQENMFKIINYTHTFSFFIISLLKSLPLLTKKKKKISLPLYFQDEYYSVTI